MMANPPIKDGAEPDGAWAQAAKLAFRFLFLAVCVAALGWSVSNFRQVPSDSRAVVFRFGQLVKQQDAGLLMAWPEPIERVVILPAADRQMEFRLDQLQPGPTAFNYMISPLPRENVAFLLTGDNSVVHMQATLLYQITDPAAYVLSAEHVAPALQRLFVASAVAVSAARDLDTILVARPELDTAANTAARTGREQLRSDLLNAINRRLEDLTEQGAGFGVTVSRVDLVASIPTGAKFAFDSVLVASQQADREVANARTRATMTAQRANEDRNQIATDAQARAAERINDAKTRTAAITAYVEGSPGLSGPMLANRIYYDRIGGLLGKAARVDTLDKDGGVNLMLQGPVPR
jgi:regulator of protease activity HflC (stomatin/prohibitin superfamily)